MHVISTRIFQVYLFLPCIMVWFGWIICTCTFNRLVRMDFSFLCAAILLFISWMPLLFRSELCLGKIWTLFNYLSTVRYHAIHKEVYNWFGISFDEFGRTSSPQQTEVCQAIFGKLLENNWLSENTMQQVENYLLFELFYFCSLVSCTEFIYLFYP